MEIHSGVITHINTKRGFGFIEANNKEERLFFHISGVICPNFTDLKTGMPVEFFITECRDGREKAIGIIAKGPGQAAPGHG